MDPLDPDPQHCLILIFVLAFLAYKRWSFVDISTGCETIFFLALFLLLLVLFWKTSVADPDPGSGSRMNNPDHVSQSLETIFWLKYLISFMRIRDKKIRIRDGKKSDL
jgi:hypothetical protein